MGKGFPLREGRVRWDIGKEFFPVRLGRPWHRFGIAKTVPKASKHSMFRVCGDKQAASTVFIGIISGIAVPRRFLP